VFIEPEGEIWPVVADLCNRNYRIRPLSLSLTVHEEELADDHTGSLNVWTGVRIKNTAARAPARRSASTWLPNT
jgi:hypothetical protein